MQSDANYQFLRLGRSTDVDYTMMCEVDLCASKCGTPQANNGEFVGSAV